MRINKMFKTERAPEAQAGVVTLSGDKKTEAASEFGSRNIKNCAPCGYSFCAPAGEEALMASTMSCAGTKMEAGELSGGEICNGSGGVIYGGSD